MTKYFWREKNADKCLGQGEIVLPTRDELEKELILKLEQKLSRIDVVFDKNAREEYYLNDKKPKSIKLEGLSEKEIQRALGENVVVDFVQLVRDVCQFYGLDFNALSKVSARMTKQKICDVIRTSIDDLTKKKDLQNAIENVYRASLSLARLLGLNIDEVEKKRQEKEIKQGNFFRGKYVLIDL